MKLHPIYQQIPIKLIITYKQYEKAPFFGFYGILFFETNQENVTFRFLTANFNLSICYIPNRSLRICSVR